MYRVVSLLWTTQLEVSRPMSSLESLCNSSTASPPTSTEFEPILVDPSFPNTTLDSTPIHSSTPYSFTMNRNTSSCTTVLYPHSAPQVSSLSGDPTKQLQRVSPHSSTSPSRGPLTDSYYGQEQSNSTSIDLIPRRRRKTSPKELEILECEFRRNPLPSQAERGRIAERIGMTGRAAQVWFQNRRYVFYLSLQALAICGARCSEFTRTVAPFAVDVVVFFVRPKVALKKEQCELIILSTSTSRRQKEKKDTNSYPGSGASSEGSVIDPDQDSRDLEPFTFSSSPAPPVTTTLLNPFSPSDTLLPESLPTLLPVVATAIIPAPSSTPIVLSSNNLFQSNVAPRHHILSDHSSNKENSSPESPASALLMPLINALVDQHRRVPIPSLLSSSSSSNRKIAHSKTKDTHPRETFQHRSALHSNVTAKKHMTKRPLGGSAPLARKPSLSHNFEFPPSPLKKGSTILNDEVSRATPLNSVAKVDSVIKRKGSNASISSSAGSSVGIYSLTTNESGRARVWVDELVGTEFEDQASDVGVESTFAKRGGRRVELDNEVWKHMESDPPSGFSPSNSPAPLTRRMMSKLNPAEDEDGDERSGEGDLEEVKLFRDRSPSPTATKRPRKAASSSQPPSFLDNTATSSATLRAKSSLSRTLSLGRIPQSQASSSHSSQTSTGQQNKIAEASRAGGEESCAREALSRKRARMIPTESNENGSERARGTVMRKKSDSTRVNVVKKAKKVDQNQRLSTTPSANNHVHGTRRNHNLPSLTQLSALSPNSLTAAVAAASVDDDPDSSMGELSFGSSTTEGQSLDSEVSINGNLGVAKMLQVVVVGQEKTGESWDERECAELLLGLGGW